ncbi:GAF domain-containing protein [Hymenobacter sp. BT186]|uniref:GAF domain-containing protein n=1 Tax=Hymenobacter telluris TaxID=2816474 RepID=A0A939ET08_9BACT|nr:GAF domain-containing protein [Hymenobacter telluris]MBO0356584.1 GAF domain-containing protein [Hymenobacter telluris]MBW3372609.1 GAF domain-containing protein [Hymenobacter norwichensis]
MASAAQLLIPADEVQRLGSIRHYDVAQSLQEPIFSEFVSLTARIFSLPISLIALVEEEQVHYMANFGLPNVKLQPRVEALCSTAILNNKAVIYSDLASDTSPLITPEAAHAAHNKGLRFYAAAPLCMPNERRFGSLCVIDRQPRSFSPDEQALLERIANLISQMITVRYCCLATPGLGLAQWQLMREQIQEEIQGLAALVRYLITRHGTQIPVSQDMLTLITRRLEDISAVLDQYEI